MADSPLNKALEAATEPDLNIVNPPTRSIGRFFGDTLDFWFSNRELKYAKKQIMDEFALRKFREECEAEFAKIPEDELVPPRKALLLPALDAAEYYVEEEELRRMFARHIASICDARKISKVHPSFKRIIPELSLLDIQNLECFWYNAEHDDIFKKKDLQAFKFVNEFFVLESDYNARRRYIFLGNKNETDMFLQSASLETLRACGLVSFSEKGNEQLIYEHDKREDFASGKTRVLGDIVLEELLQPYHDFDAKTKESYVFTNSKKVFEKFEEHIKFMAKNMYEDSYYYAQHAVLKRKKYVVSLTPLGRDFCLVCLPPPPQWEEDDK